MFPAAAMSNSTSFSEEATVSSGTRLQNFAASLNHVVSTIPPPQQLPQKIKKKRNLPGNPDPDAEVIALSPKTLLATNRFVCEVCNKGFQRDQNLQLHRRGHNLPWKLKQRNSKEVKKRAYVCPEPSCVHHNPSRALGDLTGIKKHYCRKHGEKKWKCDKCSKIYAVQSDWRAHSKTCGTREYRCDCGTLFSRKDSFITHRAFCDALAEESARVTANQLELGSTNPVLQSLMAFQCQNHIYMNPWDPSQENPNPNSTLGEAQSFQFQSHIPTSWLQEQQHKSVINSPLRTLTVHLPSNAATSPHLSATALLQKAATVGASAIPGPGTAAVGPHTTMGHVTQNQPSMAEFGPVSQIDSVGHHYMRGLMSRRLKSERLTRDFLGLTADANGGCGGGNGGAVDVSMNAGNMLSFTGGIEYLPFDYHHHHSPFKSQQGFGLVGSGTTTAPETWGNA